MRTYYVYILRLSTNYLYVGLTNNLDKRIWQHETGYHHKAYTFDKRPLTCVYHTSFNDINQAIAFEKKLKGWSRKKKLALINGDFDKIHDLAKCRNESHYKNHEPGSDLK